ncbi:hypothetical protein [Streptomyces sp. CL12-4]|uniref:hypothetical protein n=1 Tax=Streptomyces sp. CL12-4 TaxID=2810306 RepID=UPI001EFA4960|nr:hypothetical protein [Streptomyces sp. CL12-4]MCG8969567.1 hypothetical protein [Streptomyces sp. CL12-4]
MPLLGRPRLVERRHGGPASGPGSPADPAAPADRRRARLRGERGPLVHCFEQTDQEDGIAVDELALSPDTVLEEVAHDDLDGVGPAVALRTRAAAVTGRHQAGLPYRTLGGADSLDTERPVTATAVPRFQWDNRGDGAMWVWMPLLAG